MKVRYPLNAIVEDVELRPQSIVCATVSVPKNKKKVVSLFVVYFTLSVSEIIELNGNLEFVL